MSLIPDWDLRVKTGSMSIFLDPPPSRSTSWVIGSRWYRDEIAFVVETLGICCCSCLGRFVLLFVHFVMLLKRVDLREAFVALTASVQRMINISRDFFLFQATPRNFSQGLLRIIFWTSQANYLAWKLFPKTHDFAWKSLKIGKRTYR